MKKREKKNLKILVTGGAGFIGAHLSNSLIASGHKVLIVDALRSQGGIPFINKKSKFIKGDITEKKIISKIKKWKPEIIYHLAAQSAVEPAYDDPKFDILTNSYGTYLICNLAKQIKVKKFIYTSSVAVYGNKKHRTIEENTVIDPDSIYGVSKYAGELFVKQVLKKTSTKTIIFRLFNTYGPGENLNNQKKGMISIYTSYLWKNKPLVIKGSLKRFRDFVFIEDCINVLTKAIKIRSSKHEIINLSFGDNYTVKNVIKLIAKTFGKKNYKYRISKGTPGDSFGFHASGKKLKKMFNIKSFTKLSAGLPKYFKWVKKVPNKGKIEKFHPLNLV